MAQSILTVTFAFAAFLASGVNFAYLIKAITELDYIKIGLFFCATIASLILSKKLYETMVSA